MLRAPSNSIPLELDAAAAEISRTPDDWRVVADRVREDLGVQGALPEGVDVKFFDSRARDRRFPMQLLGELGRGAFHVAYHLRDLFTDRELAIKVKHKTGSVMDEERQAAHEQIVEAVLSRLPGHPNVPHCWGNGYFGEEPGEANDFGPGDELLSMLDTDDFTVRETLQVGLGLARALAFLHAHRLVHGDVKPANTIVNRRIRGLRPALIDHDLISTPEMALRAYACNVVSGTLTYMAPECFHAAGAANFGPGTDPPPFITARDVYALGVLLGEIVWAERPPQLRGSQNEIYFGKSLGRELTPTYLETVPPELRALVDAMCRADWELRPSSKDVVRQLLAILAVTSEDRVLRIVPPLEEIDDAGTQAFHAPVAGPKTIAVHFVGPYRVVESQFATEKTAAGPTQLVELEDRVGRRLIGVPRTFANADDAARFIRGHAELLHAMNAIREQYPELFPGTFSDLVREGNTVWIIRPLLAGAETLDVFLRDERPDATLTERLAILHHLARSLAVLEGAGYTLPELSGEKVFFAPLTPPGKQGEIDIAAQATILGWTSDAIPGKKGFFRQELMGMASAVRRVPGLPDPTVAAFYGLCAEIGVTGQLDETQRARLKSSCDPLRPWQVRVDALQEILVNLPDEFVPSI